MLFIQQKVPRGCPRKNVFFRIRNISRRKQASGKKHAEHCLRHLNKTACEIWSIFDKVLFCVKYLLPFFHRTLQLIYYFYKKAIKVTVHLQISNFLQIWISESKYWSRWDLQKNILKKTKFWRRNRSFTFTLEVKVCPLIDSPMMLCNQTRRLSRD